MSRRLYLLLFYLGAIGVAIAQDTNPNLDQIVDSNTLQAPNLDSGGKLLKKAIYDRHKRLSQRVFILTNRFDSFFGEKKSLESDNGTQIRVYYLSSKTESADLLHRLNYKFNLKLPNLQKRLSLSIEKKGNEAEGQTGQAEGRLLSEQDRNDDKVKAGANFIVKNIAKFDMKATAGVRVDIPPGYFAELRFSRTDNFKKWSMRTIPLTFWNKEQAFGQSLSIDFDRPLTSDFLLRLGNDATWIFEGDNIRNSHGPVLFQRLSARRGLSYAFKANYSNKPRYNLESYFGSISYRQNLAKTWLYYEISPSATLPRLKDYRPIGTLTFKLEMIVGSS